MSMHRDHRVENSEPGGELPMALWVGVALIAMVAFSYWFGVA